MELLSNEYHLVGPVARSTRRNGCSLDCAGRMADDGSRSRRNGVCDCTRRFPGRSPRLQYPRSPREETSIVDRPSGPVFHSTGISADERNNTDRRARKFNADASDIRDYRRDTVGDSPGNAKRARVEDQGVEHADEKDDETMTEEDVDDCTCDAEVVTRDAHSRIRPPDRPRVIRNQRNGRRRDDAVEGEEDEEKGERIEEDDEDDEEDEEDEGERMEEEDEDAADSVYEELRARVPRGRAAARERELRSWIRRCRQECERRRGR